MRWSSWEPSDEVFDFSVRWLSGMFGLSNEVFNPAQTEIRLCQSERSRRPPYGDNAKDYYNPFPKNKMHHPYSVYILKCSDGSYYTGITNDLERRLYEHQSGLNLEFYTHRRRPVELVFHQDFNDVNQAIDFEKQVKG